MRQIRLFVGGMRCRRCVREVTARLRDVPGVETVLADAGSSMVRLSGSMAAASVLSAFAGTTYEPTLLEERHLTRAVTSSPSGVPADDRTSTAGRQCDA